MNNDVRIAVGLCLAIAVHRGNTVANLGPVEV